MAELNLLPRMAFEIVLESGEVIKGRFSHWAWAKFSNNRGIPMEEVFEAISNKKILSQQIPELVLCAVEYQCRKDKLPLRYNDTDLWDWLEELGGEKTGLLMAHSNTQIEPEGDNKNEKKNSSDGMISKGSATAQA